MSWETVTLVPHQQACARASLRQPSTSDVWAPLSCVKETCVKARTALASLARLVEKAFVSGGGYEDRAASLARCSRAPLFQAMADRRSVRRWYPASCARTLVEGCGPPLL